jgi:hypothetical protein
MAQHPAASTSAWQALVIAPEYRAAILAQRYATYTGVLAEEYCRKNGSAPGVGHPGPTLASALRSTATLAPQLIGKNDSVGFSIGQDPTAADDAGFSYKSFFGFTDFVTALAPEAYRTLASTLVERGFRGASKIVVLPATTRFRYNQLVVYSASPAMAACGEAIVADVYGAQITHVARGIDPPPSLTDGERTDWHHFLLTGRYADLPPAVREYVEYRPCQAGVPVTQRRSKQRIHPRPAAVGHIGRSRWLQFGTSWATSPARSSSTRSISASS